MNEKSLLQICLEEVAKKANPASPVDLWTDHDFVELGESIEQKTGILISRNTLKRLYGKMKTPEDYKPQRETKNALALFAGYENWNDFRLRKEPAINQVIQGFEENTLESDPVFQNRNVTNGLEKTKKRKRPMLLYLLGIVVPGLFWFFLNEQISEEADFRGVDFSLEKSVDTIPFNLVAKYTLGEGNKSGYFLNQDPLNPNTGTLTIGVNEPQFSWVTMRNGETRIKSLPFHALSKDWMGFYQALRRKTKYPLDPKDFIENGFAHLKPSYFTGKNLDSLDFNFYLKKASNFNISADEMELESRIFVPNPDGYCKGVYIKLTGDSGQIEQALFPKGCANHNNLFLPGHYQIGRDYDLSKMELPANRWVNISIKTSKNKANFFLDEKLYKSIPYPKKSGMLKAVSLQFNTRAKVDYIHLKDMDGNLVENEEF